VVRPGGILIAELYNPASLRSLVKRLLPPAPIGEGATTERDVLCRYDGRADLVDALPSGVRIVGARGIRVLVPSARVLELPLIGTWVDRAERALADTRLAVELGGLVCWVLKKA
jgi:hypothetical protein